MLLLFYSPARERGCEGAGRKHLQLVGAKGRKVKKQEENIKGGKLKKLALTVICSVLKTPKNKEKNKIGV